MTTYEEEIAKTDLYKDDWALVLGMLSEVGEIASIYERSELERSLLGDDAYVIDKAHVLDELGDVLYFVTRLANRTGFSLGEVARNNMEKIKRRARDGAVTKTQREAKKADVSR